MANESAVEHGDARLLRRIVDEIERSGGWIRFSRFMELALYEPGLGYYSAGRAKIGNDPRDGSDFVTAPELSPLFARSLARPVAEILAGSGNTIVELGGGTGRLAADLMLELETLGRAPSQYLLLDVSADLRERQRKTLTTRVPHLVDRVRWIDALPDRIEGAVVGNEVLDALPVDIVVFDGEQWRVRGVAVRGGALQYADGPLPADLADEFVHALPDAAGFPPGYETELHSAGGGLVASLLDRMTPDSVALFIDYGFPRSEYYHLQRGTGTLMAHRRHRSSTDLLADPGSQDLTAHVDFSAVARAARSVGAQVLGYASQSSFLIDCGIAERLEGSVDDTRGWASQASALNVLLSESEMGELFKVIALGQRPRSLTGFRRGDRSGAL